MLRVEGMEVRLGDFTLTADFEVARGRQVAVIGPSGSGKSTLLGAIAGFVPLARGRVHVDGRDVTRSDPDARGIAMLFQEGNLFPHLTLAQNVGLGLRPALKLTAGQGARVSESLSRVGLTGFEDRRPGDVSGGQQSRAALARVLLQKKPLFLLDEPFAALGPALRGEMLDLTRDVAREAAATVLMITHSPEDARRVADDLLFIDGGRSHGPRPVAEMLADPPAALRAYLGD